MGSPLWNWVHPCMRTRTHAHTRTLWKTWVSPESLHSSECPPPNLRSLCRRMLFNVRPVWVCVPWPVSGPDSPAWCGWTQGRWRCTACPTVRGVSRSSASTGPWTSPCPSACSRPSRLPCVCSLEGGGGGWGITVLTGRFLTALDGGRRHTNQWVAVVFNN